MSRIVLQNGRIIDPQSGIDMVGDVYIADGVIAAIEPECTATADTVIDVAGLVVAPGLIDLQVHVREPGREDRETIRTASQAALRGGVTTMVAMPNTTPVADSQAVIEFVRQRAAALGLVNILPAGALTKKQAGHELAELWELKQSGAVAVTDDGVDVQDAGLLRRIMEYAVTHDMLIMSHCETDELTAGGVMHEGWVSTQLGLPGTPAASEDLAVEKNVLLARLTGARLHLLHNSTRGAMEAIARSKAAGVQVTAEVSVQHCALTDATCLGYNTNAKMYPPLRSEEHVAAVVAAIQDGTIDALTTDHAPHIEPDKLLPFSEAAMGSVGLETFFAVAYTYLVLPGHITLTELLALMTYRPASIIRSDRGTLRVGAPADIAVLDIAAEWTVDPSEFASKGRNSVFAGHTLTGKAKHVLVGGELKMQDETVL